MNILSQTVPLQYNTIFSPYAAQNWKAALADIAKQGFTGVEIAVAYPDHIDADELNRESQNHSLSITTISTGQIFGREGLYLSSLDDAVRARAMDVVRQHISLSAKIGKPRVTIGLLRGKPDQPPERSIKRFSEALPPLAEFAQKHDVILQIEPINRDETTFLHATNDVLRLLDALGNPSHVGILYDTYHSSIEDSDMISAIRQAAGKIANVHIADSHRGLPGEGTIDFPRVVATLLDTGYRGPIALETLCVPTREHVLRYQGERLLAAVSSAQTIAKQTE